MKYLLLSALTILILGSINAQTIYESPHVKDGKTIQFTIPEGFIKIDGSGFDQNILYTTEENVDFDDIESQKLPVLAIIYESIEERTLQEMTQDLTVDLIEPNPGVAVLVEPHVTKINGRDCMNGAFKGEIDGDAMNAAYFSITVFGDYKVVLAYYALEGTKDIMSYEDLNKIMASCKEVETTREDEMTQTIYSDADVIDQEMFDDAFDTDYDNDLFETQISYYDILPDTGENWGEPKDDNTHLLSEFSFKENNGSIKVFSGGQSSNYPTDKEKAAAIQSVMELQTRLSLKKDSEFSNEDHFFQLYTISGGGTVTSVYTTLVNDELVFFVIDGGPNPVPDFKPAVRDFMLTMWVDYFEDLEVPNEEK